MEGAEHSSSPASENHGGGDEVGNIEYNEHTISSDGESSEESDTISNSSDSDNEMLVPSSPSSVGSRSGEGDDSSDSSENGSDNESFEFLFEGSELKSNEGLLEVFKIFVEERWTKKSLDKHVKLIKRLLPKPNDLPPAPARKTCRSKEYFSKRCYWQSCDISDPLFR